MAVNERVEVVTDDIRYSQEAPAAAAQSWFTPGQAAPAVANSVTRSQANWPLDFTIKVGIPAIDNNGGMEHSRVFLTGRRIVCDTTIPAPVVTGSTVVSCVDAPHGINGSHTLTKTAVQNNNGVQERRTGWDGSKE